MHTSPATPAQSCKSDPTLAICHTITQTPTSTLSKQHGELPKQNAPTQGKRKLTLTESTVTVKPTLPLKSQVLPRVD